MSNCFTLCDNSKNNEVISNYFLKPKTLIQDNQVQSLKETLEPAFTRLAVQSARGLTQPFELEQNTTLLEPITKHLFEDICPGIDGYGFVLMANQEYKQIYNLNKGDVVMSFDQNNMMIPSKIKYIVKTKINNLIMMSYINNVAISSNHKIQFNNSDWFYPKHFLITYNSKIDYLYNIVLENGCGIVVNNIKVITLGYLNTYNRDISYYATQAFVNDLAKHDINNDGYIVLE
jgi:transcriptional regulator with PAS, ATPase and Fis domain